MACNVCCFFMHAFSCLKSVNPTVQQQEPAACGVSCCPGRFCDVFHVKGRPALPRTASYVWPVSCVKTAMNKTRGYNVWTPDEEEALRRGVKKHGLGAWEVIRKDPEFTILENRTGVQLKDKFRNLVKFRHISQEESRTLKPKGSGPWSRKHSASSFTRERSLTRTPSVNELPGAAEEHENTAEHAAALLALDSKPHAEATATDANADKRLVLTGPSTRGRRNYESPSEEGDEGLHGGAEAALRRKRRRSLENRSFGIYDQRRYRSDGTIRTPGDDERTATESDDDDPNRPPRQRRSSYQGGSRSYRAQPRGRGRTRRRIDDESEETTTDEEEIFSEEEADEAEVPAEDDYVVDCPCGCRYDDGAMMVECESCKTWAHIDCLQFQSNSNPAAIQYDLNNYICLICQGKSNPMLAGVVRAAKASMGPGKARLGGNGTELNGMVADGVGLAAVGGPMGLAMPGDPGTGQLSTRYSRDRTHEAGHVLLGLANGDPMGGTGAGGASGLQRTGSKQLLRRDGAAGMGGIPSSLSSGILSAGAFTNPAYLDSLSVFLAATARPSSALGHRGPNSPRSGPTSPSKISGMGGSRAGRAASGSLAASGMDRSASQQNLEKLLAAANAGGGSLDGSLDGVSGASAAALAVSRSGLLSGEGGRASPNPLAMLRRAGSSTHATAGGQGSQQHQHVPSHLGGSSGLNGRPASRGPVGAELFGDSDDDLHHSAALAQLFSAQSTNDRLLQMLASNRAATPSQLFLEQLMRGATPDINLAPLIHGAALQGAAAAAAAATQAQLQILQQHGLSTAHPLMPDASMLPPGLAHALHAQAVMAAQGLGLAHGPSGGGAGGSGGNADGKSADKGRHNGALNHEELLQLAAAAAVTGGLGLHPMELRPGTPDTWALLRGSTPTPGVDALGLSTFMGIPPLAGFSADPTWLLPRGSPALAHQGVDGNGHAHAHHAQQHHDPHQAPQEPQAAATGPRTSNGGAGSMQPPIKQEPEPAQAPAGPTADDQPNNAEHPQEQGGGNNEDGHTQQQSGQEAPVADGGDAAPAGDAPAATERPAAPAAARPEPSDKGFAAPGPVKRESNAHARMPVAPVAVHAGPGTSMASVLSGVGPSVAEVMDLVDRKSSLGVLGTSAGDLAAAVAACGGGMEDAYFNVEDMLRSNTPALR